MNQIINLINDSNDILIMTHESPDGDAIGSAMAFFHFIKNLKKNVDIVIPVVPPVFDFLDGRSEIIKESNKNYDLAIIVDCSTKERIGETNQEFDRCKKSIVIDHHASNTLYGDINYVQGDVSSCAEVIYYFLKDNNFDINEKTGTSLMVGVLTDTNGFGNCNVTDKTFLMASDLYKLGIDIHSLYYSVLSKKNMAQFKLSKLVSDRLEFFCDGKIAFSYVLKDDFSSCGAVIGDHEGLVNIGRNIDGVMVSIFIREEDVFKVSFRSNGIVDVNKIATSFGGAGHKAAAGAKLTGNFEDIKERLIKDTIKEIDTYARNSDS